MKRSDDGGGRLSEHARGNSVVFMLLKHAHKTKSGCQEICCDRLRPNYICQYSKISPSKPIITLKLPQ